MMTYKGYAATVEFDDSVGRLHGRVVNSSPYPIATFEATDVDGLKAEFQRSIDEYLLSAKKTVSSPKNPFPENSMSDSGQNSTKTSRVQRQREG